MIKKEMNQFILDNYFNNHIEYDVEELSKIIRYYNPAFGELKISIEDEDDELGKIITYTDEDIATHTFDEKINDMVELDEPIDMSVILMKVYIDNEGHILGVSNNINGFFTKANKELAMFLTSLINKKIKLK